MYDFNMISKSSYIKIISLVCLLILIFLGASFFSQDHQIPEETETSKEASLESFLEEGITVPKVFEKTTKLVFVGDIMLTRNVAKNIHEHGEDDFRFPFEKIDNYLKDADFTVGNLECPISERGWPTRELYLFRADPESIKGLKYAGFDLLSVANNHSSDYARPAFQDTLNILEENGIFSVGGGLTEEEAYSPQVVEIDDVKVAFLAFSDFVGLTPGKSRSGVATTLSLPKVTKAISQAEDKADLVIVMFHFGEEYEPEPNARQKKLAELSIEAGADLLVGHHPHVIQPVEEYKGKKIAYSLGNFVFDQYFSTSTMTGGVLEVSIKNKDISSVELKRVGLNEFYQPKLINN